MLPICVFAFLRHSGDVNPGECLSHSAVQCYIILYASQLFCSIFTLHYARVETNAQVSLWRNKEAKTVLRPFIPC